MSRIGKCIETGNEQFPGATEKGNGEWQSMDRRLLSEDNENVLELDISDNRTTLRDTYFEMVSLMWSTSQ